MVRAETGARGKAPSVNCFRPGASRFVSAVSARLHREPLSDVARESPRTWDGITFYGATNACRRSKTTGCVGLAFVLPHVNDQ